MDRRKFSIVIFMILMVIQILTLGCGKKGKKKVKNEKVIDKTLIITIPNGGDLFATLEEHNYTNLDVIRNILSERVVATAVQQDIQVEIMAVDDSLKIEKCKINAFNGYFEINAVKSDTILYKVHAKKSILKGDSIFKVLGDFGMKTKNIGYYAWKMGEFVDATSIDIGDIMTVDYSVDTLNVKKFEKFSYQPDKTTIHEFYILGPRKLKYNMIELPFELKRRFLIGELTKEHASLDGAMATFGVIPYIRQQVNNAMQAQISFSTDARVGDKFEIFIEEKYVNGEQQPRGKVLYAQYSGRRVGKKTAYRFTDKAEASAFNGMYTYNGKRLVSNAVRTPLDRMHISSPFGYRIHPILGRKIFHHGIDLRGTRGTKVYAVSSGKVIKARDGHGGYGKEVRIKHSNGMITQYAHLSRISVRYGKRVHKGQIIGAVGSTGRSTGPHLHFGVKKNGRWVNPKTNLRMIGANKLKGNRLNLFRKEIQAYKNEMKELSTKPAVQDSLKAS